MITHDKPPAGEIFIVTSAKVFTGVTGVGILVVLFCWVGRSATTAAPRALAHIWQAERSPV